MRISDWSSDVCSSDLLRPQQNWRYELEANQSLGKWGSTKIQFVYVDAEDFVDVVPVDGGESVGNIPRAWAAAEIGRASCRERVCQYVYISVVAVSLKKKRHLDNTE